MKPVLFAAAVLTLAATSALAQNSPPPPATEVALATSALVTLPAKGGAKLNVSTPSFQPGGDIPFEFTQYRDNKFPGLNWSAGPAGTQSYAIIMQDTDGQRNGVPILHWTMFNIPATTLSLAAGASNPVPAGAINGPSLFGAATSYRGPRTPAGAKHRYHLQVFALDIKLTLNPAGGDTIDQLTAAMKDHVLASGEVVGLGQVDPNAPPPAPRAGAAPGGAGGPPGGQPPIPQPAAPMPPMRQGG